MLLHIYLENGFKMYFKGQTLVIQLVLILPVFLSVFWVQITPEGTFLDVRTIGRFCYEDDLLTLSAVYTEAQAESQSGFPRLYTDKTINSLKHRLLVYLWRRAEQDGSATAKRR